MEIGKLVHTVALATFLDYIGMQHRESAWYSLRHISNLGISQLRCMLSQQSVHWSSEFTKV